MKYNLKLSVREMIMLMSRQSKYLTEYAMIIKLHTMNSLSTRENYH